MPSDKPKVTSYLKEDEVLALDSLCASNDMTRSQGVAHLVRNYLIENDEAEEVKEIEGDYEGRLKVIEEMRDELDAKVSSVLRKNEKLIEVISELQEEVDRLKKQIKFDSTIWLTDQQIAAVTGKPKELVALWRKGIQKPRGKNVLEKLEPYQIINGQWARLP